MNPTASPLAALATGLAATLVVALIWLFAWGDEWQNVYLPAIGMVLVRFVHVLSAMIWVGVIFYVNLVQLVAVAAEDDAGRAVIHRAIAPRVATLFRHTSHLTVLTGFVLIAFVNYLSFEGIAAPKAALLAVSVLLGLAMWLLVHLAIWPAMRIVLGLDPAEAAAKAMARDRVRIYARINLILALPVTFAMIGAAHLY
jgi:uncharacterized membrane protein